MQNVIRILIRRGKVGCFVVCALSTLLLSTIAWAQGNGASYVDRAVRAHGHGWHNGAVQNWVATGTVTRYSYEGEQRQVQETFPMTLIHAAAAAGGGSKGDKLQRLVFKKPEGPPVSSSSGNPANPYSPNGVLTREGGDGSTSWHSVGPLSTQAAGPTERFIESQSDRSLEALLNYQNRGKNLKDVTDDIVGRNPGPGNASGHRDRAHPPASFEAAKDKHVIELIDAPGGGQKQTAKSPTRFYIDDATSLITRMEFDYDTAHDPFANQDVALTEVYEFSDYRDVPLSGPDAFKPHSSPQQPLETVKFPFVIERYIMGQKVEAMVFSRVLLNQNLRPENFKR